MQRVSYTDLVLTGADLLDMRGPEGWRAKVDLDILDMNDVFNCVLGQVYGAYWTALEILFPDAGTHYQKIMAIAHGFFSLDDDGEEKLRETWVSYLTGYTE